MNRLPPWARPSLHTRISLVLTAVAASLLVVLGGLWLQGVRSSIHEEVEAATRVSEQWLTVLGRDTPDHPQAAAAHLLPLVQPVGRIRANSLEVLDGSGKRLYLSPPSAYKEGREAPAWFAALVEPQFAPRHIAAGALSLVLHPDSSRAVLDAWDDLRAMAGWALSLLALLFLAIRRSLDGALRPLERVVTALNRTGVGRFDTRLPVDDAPELAHLARAFNGMADRLAEAVNENVRLESDREVARRMQSRLEEERRSISRELHDELSQGITAVRALAGAIVQRTTEQPALHSHAQSIVAVTGEMQDGVRAILHRLRPLAGEGSNLASALGRYLEAWRRRYPEIALEVRLPPASEVVAEIVAAAVLRVVQEGLTNVLRHADARQVAVAVTSDGGWLEITVSDDGRGFAAGPSAQAGSGLGLTGMGERLAALGGTFTVDSPAAGGCRLIASLPAYPDQRLLEENP